MRARAAAVLLIVSALLAASSGMGRSASAVETARVSVFFPRGAASADCSRVGALSRRVEKPAVLRGALRALLRGPTSAERARGYGGWFSTRTAGALRSVYIRRGIAYIDFRDFSRAIGSASSSCGSALLLAQLDRTSTQFSSVTGAVYSFNGSATSFYEWLQRPVPRKLSAGERLGGPLSSTCAGLSGRPGHRSAPCAAQHR